MKNGLYALAKIKKIADTGTKKMVYEACIRSHLQYALSTWGCSVNKSQIKQIALIQKAAVRMVMGKKGMIIQNLYLEQLKYLNLKIYLNFVSFQTFFACLPKKICITH